MFKQIYIVIYPKMLDFFDRVRNPLVLILQNRQQWRQIYYKQQRQRLHKIIIDDDYVN